MTDSSLGSGPAAVIRARAGVQLGTTQWPPRLDPSCLWPELVAGMRWIIWLADHPSKRRPQSGGNPLLLQTLPSLAVRMLWLEPPALHLVVGRVMGEGMALVWLPGFLMSQTAWPFPLSLAAVPRWGLVGVGPGSRCLQRLTAIPPVQGQTPLGPLLHVDLLVSAGTPTWVGLAGRSWKSPSFGFPRLCEIHTISLPWGLWLTVNEMTRLVQC